LIAQRLAAPLTCARETPMKLYSYWRSQATYRVRIAMRLKGLKAELVTLDLLKGDQFRPDYHKVNPEAVVPSLIDGEGPPLVQSLAILEYLDEKHPDPPLLPKDLRARAHVRALAQMVAMDAHPLVVPRVRKYLEQTLKLDEPTRNAWVKHWMELGSAALEEALARSSGRGRFCHGDSITIADVCLVPHMVATRMVGGDLAQWPIAAKIFDTCMQLEAFSAETPMKQPDAPANPH
jgi:maleylacetoacetate isomerase